MDENYRFGPFHVDLETRQLTDGGRPIPLTPKVFQTLAILLQNRDRIVSKRELLSTIWPQAHVEEANLTQNISVLRKALGETNSGTKFIANFPRQGYRFIGNVEEGTLPGDLSAASPAPVQTATRNPLHYLWAAGLVALLVAGLAGNRLVRPERATAELGTQRAVTHLPGRAFQPVLRMIAHSPRWWRSRERATSTSWTGRRGFGPRRLPPLSPGGEIYHLHAMSDPPELSGPNSHRFNSNLRFSKRFVTGF